MYPKLPATLSGSVWWKVGALTGASAVCLGAFGGHRLKKYTNDPKKLKYWETASHYTMMHAILLLMVPFAKRPNLAGSLIASGTFMFSASLCALALTNEKRLAMIAPVGGSFMILGWLALLL